MIFCLFSRCQKTSIPDATNTNAKEEQICPSVIIQKRALKLIHGIGNKKKGRKFTVLTMLIVYTYD